MLLRWFSSTARTENHSSEYLLLPLVLKLFLIRRPKFPDLCWASQLECSTALHFLGGLNPTCVPSTKNLFLYAYRATILPFSQAGGLVVIPKNFFCFAPPFTNLPCPVGFIVDQFQIHSPYCHPMSHFRILLQQLFTRPPCLQSFPFSFHPYMWVERSFWNTDLIVSTQYLPLDYS